MSKHYLTQHKKLAIARFAKIFYAENVIYTTITHNREMKT